MIYIHFRIQKHRGVSVYSTIKSPLLRATNFEEIKKEISEDHKIPEAQIIWVRILKPSIYQIKEATQKTEPLFFSKKTLKCFNQRMKDFKVYHIAGIPEEFHLVCKEREYIFNAFTLLIRAGGPRQTPEPLISNKPILL